LIRLARLILSSIAVLPATVGVQVKVSPADGRRLVEEAFARNNDARFTLSLVAGPGAFQIAGDRLLLSGYATLHLGMDLTCPIRISGYPVIRDNRVGLDAPDITSDDWSCRTAGAALRGYAVASLGKGGWDLPLTLVRASWDPTQTGPRVSGAQCLTTDQIRLRSVALETAAMVVQVELPDSALRQKCPG
jgi:hypothetical protein